MTGRRCGRGLAANVGMPVGVEGVLSAPIRLRVAVGMIFPSEVTVTARVRVNTLCNMRSSVFVAGGVCVWIQKYFIGGLHSPQAPKSI